MEEQRPDAEQMLKRVKFEEREQQKKNRGKLKIFLGYAAGSGKTYTMLEAAHAEKDRGIDVVAGYIEPHDRPETTALVQGLEVLPPKEIEYKGVSLKEFDLDAALKRHPQLILVDELAHTNAKGCRNEKRYQDIQELLQAGINVYTTMNIQHLESLNDQVGSITRIEVRERVPDYIFDHADQVEVIDIEPEELIERMKEGKIYRKAQADRALQNFFRRDKLASLREIALRRAADRVNRIAAEERSLQQNPGYHTGEHVLVCITAAPSSAKVIRTAARLASAFHADFTGLCVETADMQNADEKTRAALRNNMEMARLLGAKTVTMHGSDIAAQIAQYAIISNVSKIVLGRSNHFAFGPFFRSDMLEKLNAMAPDIDVYIIPDMRQGRTFYRPKKNRMKEAAEGNFRQTVIDLSMITLVLAVATIAAFAFQKFRFSEANTIMIYILGVVFSAYIANRTSYALYSSLASVLLFNFFFTKPYYTLKAYDKGYPTTFVMLFIVGLVVGTMTRKLKQQSRENAKTAYRTEILLENSQKLRRCKSKADVWNQVAQQAVRLLDLSVLIYPVREADILAKPLLFPRKGMPVSALQKCVTDQEEGVARWVVRNHHRAGACTHTLPEAMALYLPIQDSEEVKGVMAILLEERRPIPDSKYGLLIAMLNETGVKLQDTFLTE